MGRGEVMGGGWGMGGRSVAGFCLELTERNPNMTLSRPKLARESMQRGRKSWFEGHWGSLGVALGPFWDRGVQGVRGHSRLLREPYVLLV